VNSRTWRDGFFQLRSVELVETRREDPLSFDGRQLFRDVFLGGATRGRVDHEHTVSPRRGEEFLELRKSGGAARPPFSNTAHPVEVHEEQGALLGVDLHGFHFRRGRRLHARPLLDDALAAA